MPTRARPSDKRGSESRRHHHWRSSLTESSLGRDFASACEARILAYCSAPPVPPFINAIDGWLTPEEAGLLYGIALKEEGPFLEIGSWVGRSTASIALGIKDSGKHKEFVTVDLNPKLQDFRFTFTRSLQGAEYLIPRPGFGFYPLGSKKAFTVCTPGTYKKSILPALKGPGRVIGMLKKNLSDLNLLDLVTIKEGDFRAVLDKRKYAFVFCDALHSKAEMDLNLPAIRELVSVGSVVACHDVYNEEIAKYVQSFIPFRFWCRVDTVGIGFL